MPAVRRTTLVAAPPRTVAGALRDPAAIGAALRRVGLGMPGAPAVLAAGDVLRFRLGPVSVRTRLTAMGVDGMASVLVDGPLRVLAHDVALSPDADGTRMVDEVAWELPGGRVADGVARCAVRRLLAARAAVLAARAEELQAGTVVVATALVRDGAVLAAQRTRPPALAGLWELPGGRVEPGETEPDAVARECREELGAEVVADGGRVGTDLPIAAGVLRVHAARLAPGTPEPRALEHTALRWVPAAGLARVGWVPADRAVLADLARYLTREGCP